MHNFLLTSKLQNPYHNNERFDLFFSENVYNKQDFLDSGLNQIINYHNNNSYEIENGITDCKNIITFLIDKNKVKYNPDIFSPSEDIFMVKELNISVIFKSTDSDSRRRFTETIENLIEKYNKKYNQRRISLFKPFELIENEINDLVFSYFIVNKSKSK